MEQNRPIGSLLRINPGHAAAFSWRAILQARYELAMKGISLDGWRPATLTPEGVLCMLSLEHCGVVHEGAWRVRDALPFLTEDEAERVSTALRRMSYTLSPGEEKAMACALKAGDVLRGPFRRRLPGAPARFGPPVRMVGGIPEPAATGPEWGTDAHEEVLEEAVAGGCSEMVGWILRGDQVRWGWVANEVLSRAVVTRDPAMARQILAAALEAGEEPRPEVLARLFELEEELRWQGRAAWVEAVVRARPRMSGEFISGFYGGSPRGHRAEGVFSTDNCGGESIWTIGPPVPDDEEGLLWSVRFRGLRYVYVFYPYWGYPDRPAAFFEMFAARHPDVERECAHRGEPGEVLIIQVSERLPGHDPETGLWHGLESDELGGILVWIDTQAAFSA